MKLGIGSYREVLLTGADYCLTHFDLLELQDFVMPDNLENERLLADYRGLLAGFAGEVTIHGPYINLVPTSIDRRVREVAEARYLEGVAVAQALGADKMVIHSFYDRDTGFDRYDELWLEQNLEFWSRFTRKISGSGVTVLLENCHDRQAGVFNDLVGRVDSPHLSTCLDLGHAHCLSDSTLEQWLTRNPGQYFHISDNDGAHDSHLLPGEGKIGFATVARQLAATGDIDEIRLVSEAKGDFAAQLQALQRLGALILESADRVTG